MPTSPETVIRRLIEEGFNDGDLDVADELHTRDSIEHQRFGPSHPSGPEGVKAVIRSLRSAYSDFHLEIEDLAVADEVVWIRMSATGTNDGSFMGHPPTGLSIQIDVFDAVRVRDGRIVEHWGVPDRLGALLQLGLLRPPAPAPA